MSIKKRYSKELLKDSFIVDSTGVVIATFITPQTRDKKVELMNVSAWMRGEKFPEPDETKIAKYDLANISTFSAEDKVKIASEIEAAFDKLQKEELIALGLHNVPGITLRAFVPKSPGMGGAVQWELSDIQKLISTVRKACGVTVH